MPISPPHRRVVTGHAEDGRSVLVSDGPAERAFDFMHTPGMSNELMWATDAQGLPVDIAEAEPAFSFVPPGGGARMMIVRFPPDAVFAASDFDPAAAAEEQLRAVPGLAEMFEADDPGFHRTPTVDYGVVIEGELTLRLDASPPVTLRAGDVFIQNATRHAWSNPTSRPAVIAVVLVGAPDDYGKSALVRVQ